MIVHPTSLIPRNFGYNVVFFSSLFGNMRNGSKLSWKMITDIPHGCGFNRYMDMNLVLKKIEFMWWEVANSINASSHIKACIVMVVACNSTYILNMSKLMNKKMHIEINVWNVAIMFYNRNQQNWYNTHTHTHFEWSTFNETYILVLSSSYFQVKGIDSS